MGVCRCSIMQGEAWRQAARAARSSRQEDGIVDFQVCVWIPATDCDGGKERRVSSWWKQRLRS